MISCSCLFFVACFSALAEPGAPASPRSVKSFITAWLKMGKIWLCEFLSCFFMTEQLPDAPEARPGCSPAGAHKVLPKMSLFPGMAFTVYTWWGMNL